MYMPAGAATIRAANPSYVAAPQQQYVAPATTSCVAAPQQQYVAPATTSYAAAPQQQYVAPATTSYGAAPQQQYVAPATTTYAAAPQQQYVESCVAAPQQVMVAPALAGFNVPQPQSLTAGLVAPAKIEAERASYSEALAAQLAKQSSALMEEAKIKKQMLEQQAKTQVAQAELTIGERLKMDVLRVDQEAQNMLNCLNEAAITQGTNQEETCAIAVADYKRKEALMTMNQKSYAIQKQWFESENKLTAEYQRVMQTA